MGADHGPDLGDEGRLAAEDLAAVVGEGVGRLAVLDVLDDPAVGARLVTLASVFAQPLDRPRPGPDPLDRGDLVFEREDRFDLQRRPDPGPGAADPAPAPQVLEGVDREPHLQLLAGLLGARHRALAVGAACRRCRRGKRAEPHPAAGRARVVDVDPLAALALGYQSLAGLPGRLERARDSRGNMDRGDFATGVEQRLVDLDEIADRRLRGGRGSLRGAQLLVEGGVVADLGLRPLVAVDRDVEADQLDAPLGDQVARQIAGRIADHRGLSSLAQSRSILSDRRGST